MMNQRSFAPQLTSFFFQFVVRQKYKEGQWVDRRLLGRRTQQEDTLGFDLEPLKGCFPNTPDSYEIRYYGDCETFLGMLSELEGQILLQRLNGESVQSVIRTQKISSNKYKKVLKSLQEKANFLI